MRVRGASALRVALVLLASSALIRSGPAEAQDVAAPSALIGYQGSAASSGLRVLYNPSGLLPIAAPVDLGAPDALATITSGPSTFARASVADPGDLLANPSALMSLADPSLSGLVPPYPYRVSAASALGAPTAEVSPAPGLNARVQADDEGSRAEATTPAVEAPAIVRVGTMAARASTTLDGDRVVVRSRVELAGVDVLGVVRIDSVVTDLTATSGEDGPVLEGGTVVSGASILGQPITIDANGIRSGNGSSRNPLVQAIDAALGQVGIRLHVVEPVELVGATTGQLTAAGLRLDLELSERSFPALGQLLDLVPSMDALVPGLPGTDDVLAAARARHLASVAVGTASVGLTTTYADPLVEGTPLPGGGDVPGIGAPAAPGFALDPIAPTPRPVGRSVPASEDGPVSFGVGVGGVALAVLLLQPLVGGRLARWATLLLAADDPSTCPREGPR